MRRGVGYWKSAGGNKSILEKKFHNSKVGHVALRNGQYHAAYDGKPLGTFDDQVDAIVQVENYSQER